MRNRNVALGLAAAVLLIYIFYRNAGQIATSNLLPQDIPQALEEEKHQRLRAINFDPFAAASEIKAPQRLPSGGLTFDTSLAEYSSRLSTFTSKYFSASSELESLNSGISVILGKGNYSAPSPSVVWSTSPQGTTSESFKLWEPLLQNPSFSSTDRAWEVRVLDDTDVAQAISGWAGADLESHTQAFPDFWRKLRFGVLRADVFRYMCVLWEGGLYADSDTGVRVPSVIADEPITHPYLWGVGARPILTRRQQALLKVGHNSYQPPYSHRKLTPSITSEDINVVVGIEWDRAIAYDWRRILRWDPGRWRRAQRDAFPRRLQFVQYILLSKPHHPIFLDTLATIAAHVEAGQLDLGALDLTGPGPFTDAVLRYLVVQYGVVPSDLRSLGGPVQVGDVLILPEESMLAPHKAMRAVLRAKGWVWDLGYNSWRNGRQVVFHGLAGSWKGQGWN